MNLIDWGVSEEDIEDVLGEEMPSRLKNIKEYCLEKEIEFSIVKENLQMLIKK